MDLLVINVVKVVIQVVTSITFIISSRCKNLVINVELVCEDVLDETTWK